MPMQLTALFIANSVLFGVALAMDAFSVSLVNGLAEPAMPRRRQVLIAGTFALFQVLMPLVGWLCVHFAVSQFEAIQPFIPWAALILLAVLGTKMLAEGIQSHRAGSNAEAAAVGMGALLVQGVATSIDALSVGFTIAEYAWPFAVLEALIIGVVTFAICLAGLHIGRRFGTKLSWKAQILGGIILIAIGLEIFFI